MPLLEQLKADPSVISSTLDNAFAKRILDGDTALLLKAIKLTHYNTGQVEYRNVRIGASRIVEYVAEIKPELVAPHLEELLPALESPEPQTKWLLLVTLGYCAELNPMTAIQGVEYAQQFIRDKQGLGVAVAAEKYLGYIGSLSPNVAHDVLPILLYALDKADEKEINWVLDSLIQIWDNLQGPDQEVIVDLAKPFLKNAKPNTAERIERIIQMGQKAYV